MIQNSFEDNIDKNKKIKFSLHKFIATFGFIGRIKYMPGTFGSLAAFPLWFLLVAFAMSQTIILDFGKEAYTVIGIQILAILVLFIGGVISGDYYSKAIGVEDPKDVVIDEVVGQLITINLCMMGNIGIFTALEHKQMLNNTIMATLFFILPFLLFRLFDIFKPWPIGWLDRSIKGGIGIMLDDVMAAIFAVVSHYIIIILLIDFYWGAQVFENY
ncbi:MAG: phosphatidylglycerophosphatase A [Rickettsiaceae bacterium]|nr:phosphatidylglycerophosphatase A [Rickettsiaceae bacterium]